MSAFPDFYYIRAAYLSTVIALSKYINFACSNWGNYNQNNNFMSYIANDKGLKSKLEALNQFEVNLNNPDKIYSINN